VHVSGESANESLIHFDGLSASPEFHEGAALHGKPDAVHHEPSRLLSDADSAGHFVGTDSVLAIGDHPNGGKPFVEGDWGILENGSHLRGELPLAVDALALPLALIGEESGIGAATGRAHDSAGPSQSDHVVKTILGIGEEYDCLLKCLWLSHVVYLSQSIGERT
jgi:hypothetical protein